MTNTQQKTLFYSCSKRENVEIVLNSEFLMYHCSHALPVKALLTNTIGCKVPNAYYMVQNHKIMLLILHIL